MTKGYRPKVLKGWELQRYGYMSGWSMALILLFTLLSTIAVIYFTVVMCDQM